MWLLQLCASLNQAFWFSNSNYCYLPFGRQIRLKYLYDMPTCQSFSPHVMWWIKWSWKIIIVIFIYSIWMLLISTFQQKYHFIFSATFYEHSNRINRWMYNLMSIYWKINIITGTLIVCEIIDGKFFNCIEKRVKIKELWWINVNSVEMKGTALLIFVNALSTNYRTDYC